MLFIESRRRALAFGHDNSNDHRQYHHNQNRSNGQGAVGGICLGNPIPEEAQARGLLTLQMDEKSGGYIIKELIRED